MSEPIRSSRGAAPARHPEPDEAAMRPLAGESLLQAWELGAQQAYLDRALTALRFTCPGLSLEQLIDMSIPQRNLYLLQLRQISFGSALSGVVPCPHCSSRLEFSVPIRPLLERMHALAAPRSTQWSEGEVRYSMRQVNSRDLALALAERDSDRARHVLINRCVSRRGESGALEANAAGEPPSPTILARFTDLHAAAEIVLQLSCPACGRVAPVDFDIARFIWTELSHAAARLLREVHELASAYGWTERDILNMQPQRRSAYLEMLHS